MVEVVGMVGMVAGGLAACKLRKVNASGHTVCAEARPRLQKGL